MHVPLQLSIWLGKGISFTSTLLGKGAGATWPGEVALRLNPLFVKQLVQRTHSTTIIAGTNGKTTSARMLRTMLEASHRRVVTNSSGANLLNGIASALIHYAPAVGLPRKFDAVFEVDEAYLPQVIAYTRPRIIVLLNLFRDQLDRYGEVDSIARIWKQAMASPTLRQSVLIANGDDPYIVDVCQVFQGKVVYFGLQNPSLYQTAVDRHRDLVFCPSCGNRLTYAGQYFSHLGKFACGRCAFDHPDIHYDSSMVTASLPGVHNLYNTLAAFAAAKEIGIETHHIELGLSRLTPAFGRLETISYNGVKITLLLSKNPTGFTQSLRTSLQQLHPEVIMLALNDRIPDGIDVSWIWDVAIEELQSFAGHIILTGERAYDLAIRCQYAGIAVDKLIVIPEFASALSEAIRIPQKTPGTLCILPTYSAMLAIRTLLTGRAIEQ